MIEAITGLLSTKRSIGKITPDPYMNNLPVKDMKFDMSGKMNPMRASVRETPRLRKNWNTKITGTRSQVNSGRSWNGTTMIMVIIVAVVYTICMDSRISAESARDARGNTNALIIGLFDDKREGLELIARIVDRYISTPMMMNAG